MTKKPLRLINVIGKVKLFFSFDPLFEQCDYCRWRKARRVIQVFTDGGSRKSSPEKYCDKCYAESKN